MHSALYAFFHHNAGHVIRLFYVAAEVVVVCAATAAAYEFCKAVFAALAGEQAGRGKARTDIAAELAFKHVAHIKIFVARELVAGINIAVRHHRKIFVARAAGRYPF